MSVLLYVSETMTVRMKMRMRQAAMKQMMMGAVTADYTQPRRLSLLSDNCYVADSISFDKCDDTSPQPPALVPQKVCHTLQRGSQLVSDFCKSGQQIIFLQSSITAYFLPRLKADPFQILVYLVTGPTLS